MQKSIKVQHQGARRFLVGFQGAGQCVYGAAEGCPLKYVEKLGRSESRAMAKNLDEFNDKVIYELVPVAVVKGKPKHARKAKRAAGATE